MNKTLSIIIFVVILAIAVVIGLRFFGGSEDVWICENGQWVKHGNPSYPMPDTLCLGQGEVFTTLKGNSDIIKLTNPERGGLVRSPLEIQGEARGMWYFEASFPVKILDVKGDEIASGIAQATGDWMTENYVPFKTTLNFLVVEDIDAVLVLKKDNPSGLLQNEDQLEIPIRLTKTETMAVKIFFNNSKMDPEFSCNKVFSVDRVIAKTEAPARASLELLLAGTLSEEEKAEGFSTSINSGVKIQSLTIENGVAKVDFNTQLQYQVGGSCRVGAISAQIRETLRQFSTVKDVVISIDGRTEDILQP